MPRPRKYRQKGNPRAGAEHLVMVCSVSEAAKLFNVSPTTIYYHIREGNIAYRSFRGSYVISTPSLIAYYNYIPAPLKFLQKTTTV